MNVDRYMQFVPEIEARIREMQPDALVWGMGPTAWLLPWIDHTLLDGVELWTAHDGCRIRPADHVVVMDGPHRALHPDTSRYAEIVKSRPKRFWIIESAWIGPRMGAEPKPLWQKHLPKNVHGIVNTLRWRVWNPHTPPGAMKPKLLDDMSDPQFGPDTLAVSPTGTTTLAWAAGRRRIGVIGVDMMRDHHHTYARHRVVDAFFCRIADQAHERGGAIFNLSPVTSLQRFKEWKPPESTSPATAGSATPAPKQS